MEAPLDFAARLGEAFQADLATPPALSLRGGNAVDSYDHPPPLDPQLDEPTDDYFERFTFWGLAHLDPASWRHYLPPLLDLALRQRHEVGSLTVEALLYSLCPPDRDPPRLASLTPRQAELVAAFLLVLAFDEASAYEELALDALEGYWLPYVSADV